MGRAGCKVEATIAVSDMTKRRSSNEGKLGLSGAAGLASDRPGRCADEAPARAVGQARCRVCALTSSQAVDRSRCATPARPSAAGRARGCGRGRLRPRGGRRARGSDRACVPAPVAARGRPALGKRGAEPHRAAERSLEERAVEPVRERAPRPEPPLERRVERAQPSERLSAGALSRCGRRARSRQPLGDRERSAQLDHRASPRVAGRRPLDIGPDALGGVGVHRSSRSRGSASSKMASSSSPDAVSSPPSGEVAVAAAPGHLVVGRGLGRPLGDVVRGLGTFRPRRRTGASRRALL
jgi:hypothetical protein